MRPTPRSGPAGVALVLVLVLTSFSTARADGALYNEYAGPGINPLDSFDFFSLAAPVFVDLDDDGDRDMVVSWDVGQFRYFENVGPPAFPGFVERFGPLNPVDGIAAVNDIYPSFGDLDDDGDLDLVYGTISGLPGARFYYWENIGDASSGDFVFRTGASDPFDSISASVVENGWLPDLVDLDADGDLDVIAGTDNGRLRFFENTGTPAAPAFTEQTGGDNPLDGEDLGSWSRPRFFDFDGDGDFDLLGTGSLDFFTYFENTGGATNPAFSEVTGARDPFDGEVAGFSAAPSLFDADGDGDMDVVVGDSTGALRFYSRREFGPLIGTGVNPLDSFDFFSLFAPVFVDLDDDGDRDMVVSWDVGQFRYFENVGPPAFPGFVERFGPLNPLDGVSAIDDIYPTFGDLDDDGDLDLVYGTISGLPGARFYYWENIGDASSGDFVFRTGASDPFDSISASLVENSWLPDLVDLDADGDLDVIAGTDNGRLRFFENTGTPAAPAFAEQTGNDNPLDGEDLGSFSRPRFFDFDGDGDFDLLGTGSLDFFTYFENTGDATSPTFVELEGIEDPFDGVVAGFSATPDLFDVDGDGDLDLLAGRSDGTFAVYAYCPEPGFFTLLASGCLALAFSRRRLCSRS